VQVVNTGRSVQTLNQYPKVGLVLKGPLRKEAADIAPVKPNMDKIGNKIVGQINTNPLDKVNTHNVPRSLLL